MKRELSTIELKELLERYEVRPSHIRILVMRELMKSYEHPGVEEIYSILKEEVPTLSKTSVYNTLKALVAAGAAKEISVSGDRMRYDADISLHGHFKCDKCGKVVDLKAPSVETDSEGFLIRDANVFYYGLCSECRRTDAV